MGLNHLQLTEHFNSKEFFVSSAHPDIAAKMELTTEIARNLYLWCYLIGEPVRKQFGHVEITSGYRDKALNAAVGGVDTSQHSAGLAADFLCRLAPAMQGVHRWIVDNLPNSFSQCLYYVKKGHVHASCPELGIQRYVAWV